MCSTIPPPLHTPRSVVARTSSPGLGRTVCGHGRQVRAQPGLGGSLLLHRRVCLWRSTMTIRLARCAAASIGANRSAIEVTHFSKARMPSMSHDHVVKNLELEKLSGANQVPSHLDVGLRRSRIAAYSACGIMPSGVFVMARSGRVVLVTDVRRAMTNTPPLN